MIINFKLFIYNHFVIWGGFSVNNATLNRFFALHFVLPFVLAALALMHLIALHDSAGSGNPLGVSGNYDRLPFAPYFIFKDLITIFIFILILSMFVFFMPNLLGDSENYVMANPMQTPPAMKTNILCCLLTYDIWYGRANIWKAYVYPAIKSYTVKLMMEDKFNLAKYNNENNLSDDKEKINISEKGFITINNQKQEITKLELLNLIESIKKTIINNKGLKDAKFFKDFRQLVNGVFQAEGHVGGYFPNVNTTTFRPTVYISQNASDSSLEFFIFLWLTLDKSLKFAISVNESSKFFHIRLLSRDWDFIINKLTPYLHLVYGDKYKGLIKLNEIYHLNKKPNISKVIQVKIINLAYSLVNLPAKKINLKDKICAVIGDTDTHTDTHTDIDTDLNQIKAYRNNKPLGILFILGFLLGDGNFTIKIRDTKKGIWFIPIIRLEQKDTLDNSSLFKDIVGYLNKLDVKVEISQYNKSNDSNHIVLTIEDKVKIRKFINIIKQHRDFFFWKKEQINLIINSLVIVSIAARHWKQSQIALLHLLYNKPHNNFKHSFDYWAKRLDEIYNERKKPINDFYICISKNRAWAVNLPLALNIKPKTKYFFFKTYNDSKKEALKAAIFYRDDQLKKWLAHKGF